MTRTLTALAISALLLSGCSGGDSESTASAPAAGAAADGFVGAPQSVPDTSGKGAGTAQTVALGQVGAATASVIRTGEMEVVVDDVDAAAAEVARLVAGARGQVEADDRARDGGPERAVLRLRVPPAAFDGTVNRVAALGTERSRRLGSEDVTEQVVDLDSRLATQRASVERVRALLAEAKTLGEVVQVEGELTRRTADLESLQARLTALRAQVDLASLTVRLTAEDAATAAAGGPLGFGDGLGAGWDALRALGRATGVTVGALLPFSPLLLVAGALLWRRRFRQAPAT